MWIGFAVACLLLFAVLLVQYVRVRRFRNADGAFLCKARLCDGRSVHWPRLRRRWMRRWVWARWVDDVLVVRRGRVVLRRVELPARILDDGVRVLSESDAPRCGYRPIAVELEVADGSRIEVVASEYARHSLVGPYLAAALHGLPRAPAPRRQIPGPGS
jgi:hypothetical protein